MPTAYITDPGTAFETLISSATPTVDRIHAGIGIVDYGVCLFGTKLVKGAASVAGGPPAVTKALADRYAAAKAAGAIDWQALLKEVLPIVISLVEQLLGS